MITLRRIYTSPIIPGIRCISSSTPCHVRSCGAQLQQARDNGTVVQDFGNRLEVRGTRWPHSLHIPHTWLRDHCRCPHCYSQKTNQRNFDVSKMSLNIRPCKVDLSGEILDVTWPDEHKSQYSLQFLWEHSAGGRSSKVKDSRHPWTAKAFPNISSISVPESAVLTGEDGLRRLVHNIEKYGVGIVSEVAPTPEATESVVKALAPIQRTFFGELWHFTSKMELADSAYSTDYLGAHNDTTYFNEGARIQIFHCTSPAPVGGDTLLVDGLQVAKTVKEKYPKTYKFFSEKTLNGEYIGDGQHMLSQYKIFNHSPVTGLMQQFRYNLYDRAPVSSLTVAEVEQYYEHLQQLAGVVTDKSMEHWTKLQAGQVLFVDNWRVMHGRESYTGHRAMAGCYMSQDDYTSRARTLGVIM